MRLSRCAAFLPLMLCLCVQASPAYAGEAFPERWVYLAASPGSDDGLTQFTNVLNAAAQAGCTHALITDGYWLKNPDEPAYLARVALVKTQAKKLGITLVPSVCPVGYSGRLFHFDPNLIASLPVRDMRFIVNGGEAVPDPALAPDLGALKTTAEGIDGPLAVKPFHHYRLTLTLLGAYTGDPEELIRVFSSDGKRWLSRNVPRINAEKSEQKLTIDWNSLDSAEVRLRISPGKATIRDLHIEPAGTLLMVRRDLVPLRVTSDDGKTVYVEGRDFEPVADPVMLKEPFDGEFTNDHTPSPIRLGKDMMRDCKALRVSFWHGYRVGTDQEAISMEDPKAMDVLEIDLRNCVKVWEPQSLLLNYDEIRVAGWEPLPDGATLTPGQLLARHLRELTSRVRKVSPQVKLYTWSDMFTPHHNARGDKPYYVVNGNWSGSWEELPKDITILNWYSPKPEGVRFFAERGNQQVLCGFYDVSTDAEMTTNIRDWLTVANGQPGIQGFMYTTWNRNYRSMPRYFTLLDQAQTQTQMAPGSAP